MKKRLAGLLILTLLAPAALAETQAQPKAIPAWESVISAQQAHDLISADPSIVVVDARKPNQYAAGHLPNAINIPGDTLRTPSAKPGKGDSQYIFRKEDGSPDIARYEAIFSKAGLTRNDHVIVYGNHAGTADGSVAAMILSWLGQEKVQFIDGIGAEQWQKAGFALTTEPVTRPAAEYKAQPSSQFVWNLSDVLAHQNNPNVVFYDTRNIKEFTGEDKRDNARGGHIPGAICLDYHAFLTSDKTTLSPEQVRQKLLQSGITPEKEIVLYCQTATRVSLPYLLLKDLGYQNVAIYDASWHEYGNREDTPVVAGEAAK